MLRRVVWPSDSTKPVFGSTGKHYAQIVNGAPYDLFLAADRERPAKLAAAGLSEGQPVTYARGRLGFWMPGRASGPMPQLEGLKRIALANPALAPYGAAAMDVLHRLGHAQSLKGKLVYGENVSQAYAMVASGAAEAGMAPGLMVARETLLLAVGVRSTSFQLVGIESP
jgi:molybdate transport system substrate-binding protein